MYEAKGWPYAFVDIPHKEVIDPYWRAGYDGAPWAHLNHSKLLPNLEAKLVKYKGRHHVMLISKYWIPKGFKLRWTYDYQGRRQADWMTNC